MAWLETLEEIRNTDWSKVSEEEQESKASEVVTISGYASAVTSIVPIPFVDLALLIPVHTAMVMTIGHIYSRPITKAEAKRIVVELGAVAGLSFAGRAAISALKKFLLPGYGGVIAAPATFALTWGLGRVSMAYFKNPNLSRDDLKKVFADAMKEGKSIFSKDAFDRFRKENPETEPAEKSEEVEKPAEEEEAKKPAEPKAPKEPKPKSKSAPKPKDPPKEAPPPDPPSEAVKKAESFRPKKRSF